MSQRWWCGGSCGCACRDIPSWRAEPFNSSRKPLIQWLWRRQQTQEQKQQCQQAIHAAAAASTKSACIDHQLQAGERRDNTKEGGITHNNTATVQAALRDLGDECVRHFHKAEMLVGSRVANIIQCSSLGCLHTYVERQKGGRCGWLGVCGGGQGRTIIMLSTLEEDLVECVVVSILWQCKICMQVDISPFPIHIKRSPRS